MAVDDPPHQIEETCLVSRGLGFPSFPRVSNSFLRFSLGFDGFDPRQPGAVQREVLQAVAVGEAAAVDRHGAAQARHRLGAGWLGGRLALRNSTTSSSCVSCKSFVSE